MNNKLKKLLLQKKFFKQKKVLKSSKGSKNQRMLKCIKFRREQQKGNWTQL